MTGIGGPGYGFGGGAIHHTPATRGSAALGDAQGTGPEGEAGASGTDGSAADDDLFGPAAYGDPALDDPDNWQARAIAAETKVGELEAQLDQFNEAIKRAQRAARDVPEELLGLAMAVPVGAAILPSEVAGVVAAVLPAHEAMVRARVAEEPDMRAEIADQVTAEAKKLLTRRTATLTARAERAEARCAEIERQVRNQIAGEIEALIPADCRGYKREWIRMSATIARGGQA